jgi:hypothetical protein
MINCSFIRFTFDPSPAVGGLLSLLPPSEWVMNSFLPLRNGLVRVSSRRVKNSWIFSACTDSAKRKKSARAKRLFDCEGRDIVSARGHSQSTTIVRE